MTPPDRIVVALDDLLAACDGGLGAARRVEAEKLLTDGYAHVLQLDAERRSLVEQQQPAAAIDAVTGKLVSLRDRLDEVARRLGRSRQPDLNRRPLTGLRPDEELAP
jgi:hypothetical protein